MTSNNHEEKCTSEDITTAENELREAMEALELAKARLAELKETNPPLAPGATNEGESNQANNSEQPAADTTSSEPVSSEPLIAEPVSGETQSSSPSYDSQPSEPQPAAQPAYQPYHQPQQAPVDYAAPGYGQSPHAGPGAVPPQQPYYAYQQPYYQQAYTQPAVSPKDHVAAGLLAIFLGSLGIHKFYLGYNTSGFIMLAVTILGGLITFGLAPGVMVIIAIIEGIMYLTKSQSEFEQTYIVNKREWF